MRNEFFENKMENLKENLKTKDKTEITNNEEREGGVESVESVESVENFGVESLNLLNENLKEAKTSVFENSTILELGGNPEELKNLTEQIDLEIDNTVKKAQEEIIKWIKLDNFEFDENKYYRIVNEKGFEDFLESGLVRSKSVAEPTSKFKKQTILDSIKDRPTPFPSFAKGAPDLTYAKKDQKNYILESDTPMYRQGDKDPDGKKIGSRHWAYRPLNEDGSYKKEITKEEITNIYKIDEERNLYKKEDVSENN